MLIYKALNIANDKVYIGQTIHSMSKRKASHLTYARKGSEYLFHRAIRKHGEHNFTWEVLHENVPDIDTLNVLEELEIIINDSYHNGYNSTTGGDNIRFSIEVRQKMSKAHKGVKKSLEHSENIKKAKLKDKNPAYRHDLDDTEIIKLSNFGYSQTQIANRLGTRQHTIFNRLRKAGYQSCGFKRRGKFDKKYIKDITIEKILEFKEQGYSQIKIANMLGCCRDTIRRRLRGTD